MMQEDEQQMIDDVIRYTRKNQLVWREYRQFGVRYYYTYLNMRQYQLYKNENDIVYLNVVYGEHPSEQFCIYDSNQNQLQSGPVCRLMFLVNLLFTINLN